MNCLLRTKTIEEEEKVVHKEIEHKNPYIRLYGSKVKSHFSQSHCEFFEESDEDKKLQTQKHCNNIDSLDHIKNMSSLTGNNSNLPASPVQNQKNPVHNRASIYSGDLNNNDSPTDHDNIEEKSIQMKNSLDLEMEEMDNEKDNLDVNMEHDSEDDKKSALIIHSRRSSFSTDSIDFDNLKENSSLSVQKFFEGKKSGDGVFFAQRQQIEEKLQNDKNVIGGTEQDSDMNFEENQKIENEGGDKEIYMKVTKPIKEEVQVQTEEAKGDCKGKQSNNGENDLKKALFSD